MENLNLLVNCGQYKYIFSTIYVDFFKKKNVPVMTVKELFDFITDPTIRETNIDEYLEKAMQIATNRPEQQNDKVDDEVIIKKWKKGN